MDTMTPPISPFEPRQTDVYRARSYLHHRLGLPNELVLDILDKAKYWVARKRESNDHEVLLDGEFSTNFSAALPYLGVHVDGSTTASGETRKVREIEFMIVSHDQGWTTEDTIGTYKTSSWFEVSIIRPPANLDTEERDHIGDDIADTFDLYRGPQTSNIHAALDSFLGDTGAELVPRHSLVPEPQRMHCDEMQYFRFLEDEEASGTTLPRGVEGSHAWYLQSNEVARGTSTFDSEYIRRYRVVWGCKANPTWVGNEGTGSGEGFIDSLQHGDWICVWARAKVNSPIVERVSTLTKALNRDEDGRTISMAFASLYATPFSALLHRSPWRMEASWVSPISHVRHLFHSRKPSCSTPHLVQVLLADSLKSS